MFGRIASSRGSGLIARGNVLKNGLKKPERVAVRPFKSKTGVKRQGLIQSIPENAVPSGGVLGLSGLFGGTLAWMKANPFTAQVGIATLKTSLADLIVQKQVEKRETIDWRRNALFIAFGGLYLGVFQWYVYVLGFQRLFPAMTKFCNQPFREKLKNKAGMKALFQQIALDFVFVQPLIYFPTFYAFKTTLDPNAANLTERFTTALNNWKTNFVSDNFSMCAFWLPMDLIIYSVPLWLRLPLNHAISFGWCCILSFLRGDEEKEEALA